MDQPARTFHKILARVAYETLANSRVATPLKYSCLVREITSTIRFKIENSCLDLLSLDHSLGDMCRSLLCCVTGTRHNILILSASVLRKNCDAETIIAFMEITMCSPFTETVKRDTIIVLSTQRWKMLESSQLHELSFTQCGILVFTLVHIDMNTKQWSVLLHY